MESKGISKIIAVGLFLAAIIVVAVVLIAIYWRPAETLIRVEVDISPDPLDLTNVIGEVVANITFPEPYRAADVNASTIKLDDTVPVKDGSVLTSQKFVARFDREEVVNYLWSQIYHMGIPTDHGVELTITGEILVISDDTITDILRFEGTDTVEVVGE